MTARKPKINVWDRLRVKSVDWMIAGILWIAFVAIVQPVRERLILIWNSPQRVDAIQASIIGLADRIDLITPDPQIAKYNPLQSMVWTPCVNGRICDYKYSVKRTVLGMNCEAPEVVARILTDRTNSQYNVLSGPNAAVVKVGTEWTQVLGSFIVPRRVPPGAASYRMRLRYECDFPKGSPTEIGRQVVEQETLPLELEIREDQVP